MSDNEISVNLKKPDAYTLAQQEAATNPQNTAWVSANAGSGKTYVLSLRVIRLMLLSTNPSQLLCLTFTKAAAAEMSNRVFKILGEWAIMPEDKLHSAITDVIGSPPKPNQLRRARQLFAMSLDTPGGLKIQTIHAFCDALLHQFPLEANVPAHFDQIDTPEQNALINEAKRNVILTSLGQNNLGQSSDANKNAARLNEAFAKIRSHSSEASIEKAITTLIHDRDNFLIWTRNGVEQAMDYAWDHFNMSHSDLVEDLCTDAISQSSISKESWIAGAAHASASMAKTIENMLSSKTTPQQFMYLKKLLLKADGTPPKNLSNKKFRDAAGLTEETIAQEQELLIEKVDRVKSLEVLQASEALFTIAHAILIEYANLKQRRNMLDFSDLIRKAADLLTRNDITAWIQYKLDRGIDHVLVDEAQDTSPLQWEIINALTSDFYVGEGARDTKRTMFVVGDEKQSIYSFQGADPNEFEKQKRNLQNRTKQIDAETKDVRLNLSFRSTEEVLNAVDTVFSLPENLKGLVQNDTLQAHTAYRSSDTGEVIIWDLIEKPEKQKKQSWLDSYDAPQEDDAELVLAKRIANEIKTWLDENKKLPGRDSPIKAGDILILVKKRDKFATAITRELKRLNLPSAGADRLNLTSHIVVEDMMALGKFAVMQLDDLALASILKSPLFNFNEEELFELTHYRKDKNLFDFMAIYKNNDADFEDKVSTAYTLLKDLLKSALVKPVFEFYAELFARHNLRKKYLKRLGNEAEEVIDGFLQAAINHDSNKANGLTEFIEWLSNANPEIKREIDLETNEIRVITAHSSKGLEAPIVFLVDPGSAAFNTASHTPVIAKLKDAKNNDFFVWQSKTNYRIKAADAFREKVQQDADEEYRRLLYVGMTRAADKLIICGYGKKDAKHSHWHSMVMQGLSEGDSGKSNGYLEEEILPDNFRVHHWKIDNPLRKNVALKPVKEVDQLKATPPDWLFKMSVAESLPPKPLTPSGVLQLLEISDEVVISRDMGTASALQKGNAVHRLLQVLPSVEVEKRDDLIDAFFAGQDLDASLQKEIRDNTKKILASPELSDLFKSNSRAEVSLSGQVKLGTSTHMITGQIDRLVVNETQVIIADYKTNKLVPSDIKSVSSTYIAQLTLYRELIGNIYPNKEVICLLVWTQNANVMHIENNVLDKQLALLN